MTEEAIAGGRGPAESSVRRPEQADEQGLSTAGAAAGPDAAEFAALDQLSTEELRERAFARARANHDLGFFWSVLRHLPHADDAESLDGSLGAVGASVDDAVALWREFTGHGYGDNEPLLRAAFLDYLIKD